MKRDLAILSGAGVAWSQRLKRLAERAPSLDIFSEGFVRRDEQGWQLTEAGRAALRRIEQPLMVKPAAPKLELVVKASSAVAAHRRPSLHVAGCADLIRSRRAAAERLG